MASTKPGKPIPVAKWTDLEERVPAYALVGEVDLVVVRYDERITVLYGRCLHRGALMSDGSVKGADLICGLHGWDYRYNTGVSSYDNNEALQKFTAWISEQTDQVFVDAAEIDAWAAEHPQPFQRETYLGLYADPHGQAANSRYFYELAAPCSRVLAGTSTASARRT
jgi:nitrite reductase/ring-hydroxylating ferredoxin subunit